LDPGSFNAQWAFYSWEALAQWKVIHNFSNPLADFLFGPLDLCFELDFFNTTHAHTMPDIATLFQSVIGNE